jgi:hypothetical protein
MAANQGWKIQKGDVSGAFLQGREYPDKLHCIPCDEICTAMGIEPGSVTRLKRACYGLVDAPLEWYKTVDEFLLELGLKRTWADACAWIWVKDGVTRGMVSGHVDDFLFGGKTEDPEWQAIIAKVKAKFKWGDWEEKEFVQCGVTIKQVDDGFELSQPRYLDDVSEIGVNATRRKDRESPLTEREKSALRALLGGLSWHAQQVAPHISAEVSLLLSEISQGNVQTLIKANTLLHHAKARKDHVMKIHKLTGEVAMYAWVDAASQNRSGGGSTQGLKRWVSNSASQVRPEAVSAIMEATT